MVAAGAQSLHIIIATRKMCLSLVLSGKILKIGYKKLKFGNV